MISKPITYDQLEEAIKISFKDDKFAIELYDPNVVVTSVDEIADDIIRKVKEHGKVQMKGIYDKNKLVGYFIRGGGMLISFGISVEYRLRQFKRGLFDIIKKDFKGMFVCFLWSKNIRGIRYLEKHGMKVMDSDRQLTKLIYQ
jgi:hypothetical protein